MNLSIGEVTGGKLNGSGAHELSARTHGAAQWWVQVEKDGSVPPPKKKKTCGRR